MIGIKNNTTATNIATVEPNRILSGMVVPVENLDHISTPITYFFNSVLLTAPVTAITLSEGNPNFDRIDVFAVNNAGELVVVEGTPAANPQEPTINFETQLRVSAVYVLADDDQIGNIVIESIYNENQGAPNEWDEITQNANLNFAEAETPSSGVLSISGSEVNLNNDFHFQKASNVIDAPDLVFDIFNKKVSNYNIYMELMLGNTAVYGFTVNSGTYGFNSLLANAYQTVAIPNAVLNPLNADFDGIKWNFTSARGEGVGFFVDNIRLIYDLDTPTQANTIDAAMSDVSQNAVQNKVIKAYVDLRRKDRYKPLGALNSSVLDLDFNESEMWSATLTENTTINLINAHPKTIVFDLDGDFARIYNIPNLVIMQGEGYKNGFKNVHTLCYKSPTNIVLFINH